MMELTNVLNVQLVMFLMILIIVLNVRQIVLFVIKTVVMIVIQNFILWKMERVHRARMYVLNAPDQQRMIVMNVIQAFTLIENLGNALNAIQHVKHVTDLVIQIVLIALLDIGTQQNLIMKHMKTFQFVDLVNSLVRNALMMKYALFVMMDSDFMTEFHRLIVKHVKKDANDVMKPKINVLNASTLFM